MKTWRDLSIGMKLNAVCIGLAVIPLLIIGVFSMKTLSGFSDDVTGMAVERLTADAERQLLAGAGIARNEVRDFVNRASLDAVKLAGSGSLRSYLEAADGTSEVWTSLTRNHSDTLLSGILEAARVQNEASEQTLRAALALAEMIMQGYGEFVETETMVAWNAVNQFTRDQRTISLPQVRLGDAFIHRNTAPDRPSPLVDDILRRVGGAATLFQRMNDQGDMLRIATSVVGNDGKRAVGTYIPALNPDGSPNAVISTVLRGETFVGRAFVVNDWFLTAYQPIRDKDGNVTGILFVGLNQNELNAALVQSILSIKLGETGYPFVMDSKANLMVHPRDEWIGKNVVTDLGVPEFQEVVDRHAEDEYGWITYTHPDGREKFISYGYFPAWDWIACVSGYLDEMSAEASAAALVLLREDMVGLARLTTAQTPSGAKPVYTQARWLDVDGKEVLAVIDGQLRQEKDLQTRQGVDWFEAAKRLPPGGVFVSPVEIARNTGEVEIRVAAPVYLNNELRGVAVLNADWRLVWDLLTDNVFGQTGYAYVINERGVLLSHPTSSLKDNTNLSDARYGTLAGLVTERMLKGEEGVAPYEFEGVSVYAAFTPLTLGENRYVTAARVPVGEVFAITHEIEAMAGSRTRSSVSVLLLIGAALLGLAVAAGLFFSRGITRPILACVRTFTAMTERNRQVGDAVRQMADGDLTQEIQLKTDTQPRADIQRGDEIGKLNRSMRDVQTQQDELIKDLAAMRAGMGSVLSGVIEASHQVSIGSTQIADASQSLSQGATESAAGLEQICASMTEIGTQAKHNADNAQQASSLAAESRGAVEKGGARMNEMVAAMSDINDSSRQIAKIIKTIDDIAFQTNLLALNAAVEAARAGRHGKGFAVVAEEVRSLAARSAKAARETAELIESSNARVESGSAIANQTAEALGEIAVGITKAADLVAEIAAASTEQARGVAEVGLGIEQIDNVTQQNTAHAEEMAAAAEELSGQAGELQEMLARFRLKGKGHRPFGQAAVRQAAHLPACREVAHAGHVSKSPKTAAKPTANRPKQILLDDSEFGKY